MKPVLKRENSHEYILDCLNQKYNGNHEQIIEFPISDIVNRNPDQVPEDVWHQLIINHMVYGNYN